MYTRRKISSGSSDPPVAKRARTDRSVQDPFNSDPSRSVQGSGALINEDAEGEMTTEHEDDGTQAWIMLRNAVSMALSDPERKVSRNASAIAPPPPPPASRTEFMPRIAPSLAQSWAAQGRPTKRWVYSPGAKPGNSLQLIPAEQTLSTLQHRNPRASDGSTESRVCLAQTWITTTSAWWSEDTAIPPIGRLDQLIVHCDGGIPAHPPTEIKTPDDQAPLRFAMPRYLNQLQVTVYVTEHTSVLELEQFLASLPHVYGLLHIVGPLPATLPICIRSRTLVFWNATNLLVLAQWLQTYSERFDHVAVRLDALTDAKAVPTLLTFACHARYSWYLSMPPPDQGTTASAVSEFKAAVVAEKRQFAPDQRLLCYNHVTWTHQLMLALLYQQDLAMPDLQALWLQLQPYDSHPDTLNIWKQHLSQLFRRVGITKSVILDLYLRVPEECGLWLMDVLEVIMLEVYHHRRSRRGRLLISPLWAIANGPAAEKWVGWMKSACERSIRPVHRVQVEVYSVPLEHDLGSLGTYMEAQVLRS